MVDDLTPQEPFTEPMPEAPAPAKSGGGFKAFLGTTLGKIVVIGCALSALGAVITVIAIVVLGFLGANAVKQGVEQAIKEGGSGVVAGGASATATPAAVEGTRVPAAVANSEVFTFRDIFEPLAVDTVPGGSEDTSSTFDGEQDTLYLLDVVTEDGVRHAVLWWNGVAYTLAATEAIAGTPWQVIEVGADSAMMLYGDSTVTLRVGQGSVAAK